MPPSGVVRVLGRQSAAPRPPAALVTRILAAGHAAVVMIGGFGPSGGHHTRARKSAPKLATQGSWSKTCGLKVVENIVPSLGQYPLPPAGPWQEDPLVKLNFFKSDCQKWMDSIAREVGALQRSAGFQTKNSDLYSRITGDYDESVVRAAVYRATNHEYDAKRVGLNSKRELADTGVQWTTVQALFFNGPHPKCWGPHWWALVLHGPSWFFMDSKGKRADPIPKLTSDTLRILVGKGLRDGFTIPVDGKQVLAQNCTVYVVQKIVR